MIELKDLTIQKGNIHILKKLNLKFQCGKSYALIGKSGCGKSTLLNTIAGLEKTGKQYVYFNGQLEQFKSNFYRDKLWIFAFPDDYNYRFLCFRTFVYCV